MASRFSIARAVATGFLSFAAWSQEITFRVETQEVVAPFAVFSKKDGRLLPGCPDPRELRLRDDGREAEIRSVRPAATGAPWRPAAVGISLLPGGIDNELRKVAVAAASRIAELLVSERGDLCTAFVAARSGPANDGWVEYLGSGIERGSSNCRALLGMAAAIQEGPRLRYSPLLAGAQPAAGVSIRKAMEQLGKVRQLRRGLLVIGTGEGFTSDEEVRRLAKFGRDHAIQVFVLHFDPYAADQVTAGQLERERKFGVESVKPTQTMVREMEQYRQRLATLATETGGWMRGVRESNAVQEGERMVDELRSLCELSFVPGSGPVAGSTRQSRRIELEAAGRPDLRVVHRETYDARALRETVK